MGYYCTVPQCTSLAGKTKNVKFHRFPRDTTMADKWNIILKRGKPYTKYSKVCSLHFTQADYNVTSMGQWKTLSKDAVPSQNLPKLNPDGTVMVIRKSRTVKYKESRKDDIVSEKERWVSQIQNQTQMPLSTTPEISESNSTEVPRSILACRLQGLNSLQQDVSNSSGHEKPKKQDAIMQTDPVTDDESPGHFDADKFDVYPGDYMKTNDEYNSEAEKYALERKNFEKNADYQKSFEKTLEYTKSNLEYPKESGQPFDGTKGGAIPKTNAFEDKRDADVQKAGFEKMEFQKSMEYKNDYDYYYPDSVEMLRNQQQNLQLLQQQHRENGNQNFFDENHIKREIEFSNEEEKFNYEQSKERVEQNPMLADQQRLMEGMSQTVKQEPETTNNNGHDIMQPQGSPYYNASGIDNVTDGAYGRPGPELLIAKQNALAAHTQLWQNTMKRPFFYSENNHYAAPQLLHRYEDITRILQ